MDTTEVLALDVTQPTIFTLLQQGVAQLAAIRAILEVEHAHAIALRRRAQPQSVEQAKRGAEPWPPPNAEPLSHIG
jgi:hypothetical protein